MKRLFFVLLFGAVVTNAAPHRFSVSDEEQLKAIAQELLDGVTSGDATAWDRHLHPDFVLTDEEGHLVSRAEMLAHLLVIPASDGRIRLGNTQVHRYGDVAVVTHRDVEREELFGQTIFAEYQATDTYVKVGGEWKLLASQVMALPRPRKVAKVAETKLREVEGTYEAAPGVTYTIRVEGSELVGERDGKAERLLPAAVDLFFPAGSAREERLFTRDADGNVVALIDRRDNNDIVWKKVR